MRSNLTKKMKLKKTIKHYVTFFKKIKEKKFKKINFFNTLCCSTSFDVVHIIVNR